MRNKVTWLLILAVVALVGALAVQYQSTRRLSSDLAVLRQELAGGAVAPQEQAERPRSRVSLPDNAGVLQRLGALEDTVSQLARNSEYLMERGQLPLAANRISDLQAKFADPTATDRDRLQALRVLRRNGGFNDEAAQLAVNWLQSATNAATRENILDQLEDATNAVLRAPLLALAATDPNGEVREQAVDLLRSFIDDPQVEAQLWKMINDPNEDVREDAIEALVEGPKTEARVAALRERATNPNSSLDERLLAWQALRESNHDSPEMSAALAQMAQSSQDPFVRAKLIRGIDDAIDQATGRDAALLPALVQGLQDPSPLVREPAANALRDFKSDPNVEKWLRWAAENDPDPAVRKEASGAFTGQNQGNRR